jgi:hypothetical protein
VECDDLGQGLALGADHLLQDGLALGQVDVGDEVVDYVQDVLVGLAVGLVGGTAGLLQGLAQDRLQALAGQAREQAGQLGLPILDHAQLLGGLAHGHELLGLGGGLPGVVVGQEHGGLLLGG